MTRLLPPKEHIVLLLQNSVEAMREASNIRLCHTLQISINFRCSYVKVRNNVADGIHYNCLHIKTLLQQNADRQTVLWAGVQIVASN
jgi:hypothetical protein